MADVAVLGLGNVLMSDDAFGPWVIHALTAAYAFPPEVSVEDLGTPGFDLVPHLTGHRAVVLVDTVRADGPPGTLRLYRRHDILAHAPSQRVGPHEPTVKESLLALDFAGDGPQDVVLVGVVPASTDQGTSLTPEVRRALPAAVQAVVAEIARLGVTLAPRPRPVTDPVWWESA